MSPALFLFFSLSLQSAQEVTECVEADLRAAMETGGLITFACQGTIGLTNTIIVSSNTTLDGAGQEVTISGNNQVRLFEVQPGILFTVRNLTLANGAHTGLDGTNGIAGEPAFGAAIFNDRGAVNLENVIFSGHRIQGGRGGDGRSAEVILGINGERGGGGGEVSGGAVFNLGNLYVTNSVFAGGQALGGSGGHGGPGGNIGSGGHGGPGGQGGLARGAAIFNGSRATVYIVDSTFTTNTVTGALGGAGGAGAGLLGFPGSHGAAALGGGGAVFNDGGNAVILNSTFSGNIALGAGGAHGRDGRQSLAGQDGAPGSRAIGAAIANLGGLSLTNSTLYGNLAIAGEGGDGGDGGSSGFGGHGGDGAAGGPALGAGLYNGPDGTATLVNNTFSHNSVRGGEGGLPGLGAGFAGRDGSPGAGGPEEGAAIFNDTGTLTLKNSILANSLNGPEGGGAIADHGFNLSSDASLQFTTRSSRPNTDPLLEPLADNGGNTRTMSLSTNSPAIRAITPLDGNGAPPFDQRGAARSHPFDIGAFESGGIVPAPALSVHLEDGQVALSWPASAPDAVLQSRPSLAPGIAWLSVTNNPALTNDQFRLSIPAAQSQEFFRLRIGD